MHPEIAPIERMGTGVPQLDQILGGGLVRGSAYIVQGPPGAGKTIMANQICHERARRGEGALYLTLLAESFGRMFSHMNGFSFFEPAHIPDRVYYAGAYATIRDEGPDALIRLVSAELRKRRPALLVIDGLFAARDHAGGRDADAAFRAFVHEIGQQAALTETTILLLTNQSRASSSPEYTMVDGWIELQDELRAERALRTLIVHKQRGSAFLRGRHEYRIGEDGLTVFPRLETQASREPVPGTSDTRLPTGVDALDTMIGGGIPERSSSVVLGPTGSGKTTVAMQFLGECTPDERGLFFGFYETPDRLARKATSVGVDLDALRESGALEVVWQPPLENLIDDLGQRIVSAVRRTGARRVVIDGINALQRPLTFPGRIHSFLRALNDILKAEGATTIYTREVPQLFFPEALAVEELSGTIDNTIILHYTLDGNAVRRRISVLKIRDSDFDHISQEFEVTAEGIVLRDVSGHERLADTTTSATVVSPTSASAGGGRVR
ncbi:ATPase domain-containing protein [Hasllibacter halocynthiae]|nr:ATPase domain-containing protein [Hasllibacter halocynthiae]